MGWGGVITYMTRCFTVLLHFPTYVMLCCFNVLLRFSTGVMLRCFNVLLHFPAYVMLCCFNVLLHFPTYVMLRCINVPLHFSKDVTLRCFNVLFHFPKDVTLRCFNVLFQFPTYWHHRQCLENDQKNAAKFLDNQRCQKARLLESKDLAACPSLVVALGKFNLPRPQPAHGLDFLKEP